MTGDKRTPLLSVEDILFYTGGGKDIFLRYLGKVSRIMKCPWRKDSSPSFGVFQKGNTWFFKDLGTEQAGTAIEFVKIYFKLSFQEALDKIKWDFSLGGKESKAQRIEYQYEKEEKYPTIIDYNRQPFQKRHHLFWNAAEVSEDWCNGHGCYAIKDLSIKRQRVFIKPSERVFIYEDEGKKKVYFPDRQGLARFRSNMDYFHLYRYKEAEKGKRVVVQKSMKDLIVSSLIYPNIIATQAEHLKIFSEEVVEKIESISKDVWVWYGSDEDGVKKCQDITKQLKWKYINTPREEDLSVNDAYSYVCKYGLESLRKFCQKKGLI